MKDTERKDQINQELLRITRNGIQADKAQLKKDMRAQFANFHEWIREYVVNAYDAKASLCRVYGEDTGEEICITVTDNGIGMSKARLLKFFTLYASEKDIDKNKAIGTHGIGKLSVAAIPNQTRFEMETSNGIEAWKASTGRLDGNEDIKLVKQNHPEFQGTTFRIYFKKSGTLKSEMEKLRDVLIKYVRFLPIQVIISVPEIDDIPDFQSEFLITEDWNSIENTYTKDYNITIGSDEFNVRLSVEKGIHEVFQNRVWVSDKYNLVSHDINPSWNLSNVKIRVNGRVFELPFGRHCISNEQILKPIAQQIRCNVLPRFMSQLYEDLFNDELNECATNRSNIYSLTCSLLKACQKSDTPWNNLEFIRTADLGMISFKYLDEQVRKYGKFYIQDEENNGIDYSHFNEPVLHHNQHNELIPFLKEFFKTKCISLSDNNIVFEKPRANREELSELEIEFENNLGFDADLLDNGNMDFIMEDEKQTDYLEKKQYDALPFVGSGILDEVEDAFWDLANLNWKVSHLVEKDLVTPSKTHLFIYSNNTIVLNLYHPEIQKLVGLSKINPKLAGHWGTSLCLEDSRNIIPNLHSETREDLLLLDGIARLGNNKTNEKSNKHKNRSPYNLFDDFKRNINNFLN